MSGYAIYASFIDHARLRQLRWLRQLRRLTLHHQQVVLLHDLEYVEFALRRARASRRITADGGRVNDARLLLARRPVVEDSRQAVGTEALVVDVDLDALGAQLAQRGQHARVDWCLDQDGVAGVQDRLEALLSALVVYLKS